MKPVFTNTAGLLSVHTGRQGTRRRKRISVKMTTIQSNKRGEAILSEQDVLEKMNGDIRSVQDIVTLPTATLRILLDFYRWDMQEFLDGHFSEEKRRMFEEVQCEDPKSKENSKYNIEKRKCESCFHELYSDKLKNYPCGHIFCIFCWLEYLRGQILIEGRSIELECPKVECSTLINDDLVSDILKDSPEVMKHYWTLQTKRYVEKKDTLRWCPNMNCKNAIYLASGQGIKVRCSCSQEFCFGCTRSYHFSVPCKSMEEWEKLALNDDSRNQFETRDDEKENLNVDVQFQMFREKFRKIKDNLGFICLDKNSRIELHKMLKDDNGSFSEFLDNNNIMEKMFACQREEFQLPDRSDSLTLQMSDSETEIKMNIHNAIQSLYAEMAKDNELEFSIDHLEKAARILEDAEQVSMYSQVMDLAYNRYKWLFI